MTRHTGSFQVTRQSWLSNLSLRARINLIGFAIVLMFAVVLYVLILPQIEREKLTEREGKLRAVIGSAVSLMDASERQFRRTVRRQAPQEMETLHRSQAAILELFRDLRYDRNEFLFILDGQGNVVMHALRPELEGTSILDLRAPDGVQPFRGLVLGAQRDGEAAVRHRWHSKYSDAIFEPQLTYGRYFWPWDWVVCSSVYVQDIKDATRDAVIRTTFYVGLAVATSMLLLFLFNYYGLARPLDRLLNGIRAIRRGHLDTRVLDTSQDELGYISRQFNAMVEEVANSRRDIERSEKKYKDLTELLPDIIYETDADLNLTYLNAAAFELTGYTRDDLEAGLPLSLLVPDDDLAPLRDLLAAPNRPTNRVHAYAAHRIIRKDGGILFGENNTVRIRDRRRVRGLRGMMRDVTEKLELERSLAQAQKMETIGTLAGGIAHDFNNILAGIIGTISLMEDTLKGEGHITREQMASELDSLNQAADRAVDMVNQILGLSRRHTLTKTSVDLRDVLTSVEALCRSSFDRKIELVFDLGTEPEALITADRTQLEQILLNLCVNARDAMTFMQPDGRVQAGRLTVALGRFTADSPELPPMPQGNGVDYWCVKVSDEGVGMDQTTLAAAFDPFYTTKEKGKGTGLGLTMVFNILQQHGGHIDFDSEPGRGTTARVFLPVAKGAPVVEPRPTEPGEIIRGEGTILIIDDDVHVRQIGQRILERAGYHVVTADDGLAGVQTYEAWRTEVDLVILDLVMPKLSGREVFERLLQINPQVRVLMASGFRQDGRVQEVLDLGAAGFIQKPFRMAELAGMVAEILNRD